MQILLHGDHHDRERKRWEFIDGKFIFTVPFPDFIPYIVDSWGHSLLFIYVCHGRPSVGFYGVTSGDR
jgi:hypothetical protein